MADLDRALLQQAGRIADRILGCEWGRRVGLPDDREPCPERAVQRIALHGSPRAGTYLVQLCARHRDVVMHHTNPRNQSAKPLT